MDWLLRPDDTAGKLLVMVLAILLFAGVMALILFAVDRSSRTPRWVLATAFVGPAILLVSVGLVYPGILTILNSFKNTNGTEWVGFDNYATAFGEGAFQLVLRNSAIWVIAVPLVATAIGLIYAVLVDRTRFEKLAKALIFLPMAISMVGASIIWKFVYEFKPDQPGVKQTGLLNQLLVWVGLEPQQFLITQPWNTFFLIVVMIWIQTGFAMTVLSAAIKAIPDDIIEAARLDGVKGVGMFRHITIPSVRPALVVVMTTIAMGTLKVFDIVRTMTGGQFGTSVIANEFYTQQFRQANQGLSSALAVILFVLVIPIVVYNIGQMKKSEEVR
ncbi:ABC transporter permease [Serinibacter arcticus]|uniref:ABC transporter permease n=1 Tax=Serinibacter arcticus TaxID=1655435 RepID=A0A2U1ZWS5_9MICO|nr:sugar ABC transporter permease [Serinibacter arcticus]PWD51435.1 ABC transporter permease [Serinibacter arcticus]